MLNDSTVTANIPASDLGRARDFYADVLGLTPSGDSPGGLVFTTGAGTAFNIYETEHAGKAGHTIAQWHVDDVAAEVATLRQRGLSFEHYDLPDTSWQGDVALMPGFGHAAWFKDSEGNIMCLDDARTG
jgi:predicted enzyme related to lactoylglutathione lyase